MSDIKYAYPLILNKVASPHYATATLRRARLIEWLNAAAGCRATVIAADAGYGKTTLMWQWEREVNFPCYWYKLDRSDRDWTFHISYLIEAIAKRHPGFGTRAHSMLQQLGGPGSSRPGVAAYLLAEMHERLTEPCTFIIDDWHYVNAVTEVRGLWNQILRDAPPTCRFIFSSRSKPKLQFARFKTHAGYAELGTDQLRFNAVEIADLFRETYRNPLNASELAQLDERTEGWPASLQLVDVSLREHATIDDRRSFIESISPSTETGLFEFLAEEVLDQQPEATRNFLLTTSILQQITPDLAERLAGVHNGRLELAELEQRGLFTHRLDDHRFRYHHLFREFLERQLLESRSESEVIALHIHAASYFETTEQWPEAIHHYLRAGLQRQAARLIARHGEALASEGRLGLIDEWLQALPGDAIRQNARLSLLHGEMSGIRGDWDGALRSLSRARDYFHRKGDARLEALACLKQSTVHSNLGDTTSAIDTAQSGLELAPSDDAATRLRLAGNLAITRTWLTEPLSSVLRECETIATEATALGLEHYAAIADHNAGALMVRTGFIREGVASLESAARYWSQPPVTPFADNAELVAALLANGDLGGARKAATDGVRRTVPWPRPHADAEYGLALVHIAEGRLSEANAVLARIRRNSAVLGGFHRQVFATSIEALFLSGGSLDQVRELGRSMESGVADPRYVAETAAARGIALHSGKPCRGECIRVRVDLRSAHERGATVVAAMGSVKVGSLALEHGKKHALWAWETVRDAQRLGLLAGLRVWLRRYSAHAETALELEEGIAILEELTESDPDGWRSALVGLIDVTSGLTRQRLLEIVTKHANRETLAALAMLGGRDVGEARRRLHQLQAPRLYLRTFGGLSLHRGSWSGVPIEIPKRRARTLLGVLAAHAHLSLTRDLAMDMLWPNTDADAAINNLNQTVFQLRRYIDPAYRGGERPEYVISTAEHLGLNTDLVFSDVAEFHRYARKLRTQDERERQIVARRLIELVQGEFLVDLRYEDWASQQQTRVNAMVHEALLPIAVSDVPTNAELSAQAASALLALDPYDEAAVLALARNLAKSGRRVAARDLVVSYVQKLRHELDEDPSAEFEEFQRTHLVNSALTAGSAPRETT